MSKDIWIAAHEEAICRLMDELDIDDEQDLPEEEVLKLTDILCEDWISEVRRPPIRKMRREK